MKSEIITVVIHEIIGDHDIKSQPKDIRKQIGDFIGSMFVQDSVVDLHAMFVTRKAEFDEQLNGL